MSDEQVRMTEPGLETDARTEAAAELLAALRAMGLSAVEALSLLCNTIIYLYAGAPAEPWGKGKVVAAARLLLGLLEEGEKKREEATAEADTGVEP